MSILFEELSAGSYKVGRATLNSVASLNALSLEMIQELSAKLQSWAKDPSLVAIFLEGAGEKAFCAGGDVRRIYESIREKTSYAEDFFQNEYRLDYSIHECPKPVIVYGHGIVMGGGLGLLVGAAFRIVTESSKLAMPEITIGLFPDVGGSYFLNRMPQGVGHYLALTGARMNAGDALFAGLADFFIEHSYKERLIQELKALPYSSNDKTNRELIETLLKRLSTESGAACPPSELQARQEKLAELFESSNLEDCLQLLETAATADPWLQNGLATLRKGSPTSARVIFEQLRRSKKKTLEEVFNMELILASQFGRHHDFPEGVRALLIDKDNKPQWKPARLEDVSDALVEEHFKAPWATKKEIRSLYE